MQLGARRVKQSDSNVSDLDLFGSVVSIIRVGGLDTQWFVAFSAPGGAAVGLASTQTIGNFIAGLYLLAARPFKVGDYVRLGTIEGVVQEITINYTKILTIWKQCCFTYQPSGSATRHNQLPV